MEKSINGYILLYAPFNMTLLKKLLAFFSALVRTFVSQRPAQ